MIIERRSSDRGRSGGANGPAGLDSRLGFSSGGYYDPAWMGFGVLRLLNETRVDPGAGFAPDRRANMDILSYVLGGALLHHDDCGGELRVGPGELHWLGAGHGVDSTVRVSTRSGSRAAIAQASAPPQSWPTTCARSAPTSSRSAVTSPTISVMT